MLSDYEIEDVDVNEDKCSSDSTAPSSRTRVVPTKKVLFPGKDSATTSYPSFSRGKKTWTASEETTPSASSLKSNRANLSEVNDEICMDGDETLVCDETIGVEMTGRSILRRGKTIDRAVTRKGGTDQKETSVRVGEEKRHSGSREVGDNSCVDCE